MNIHMGLLRYETVSQDCLTFVVGGDDCHETIARFGPRIRVFGVWCLGRDPCLPAVVVGPSCIQGSEHLVYCRVGFPAEHHAERVVEFCRHLTRAVHF